VEATKTTPPKAGVRKGEIKEDFLAKRD